MQKLYKDCRWYGRSFSCLQGSPDKGLEIVGSQRTLQLKPSVLHPVRKLKEDSAKHRGRGCPVTTTLQIQGICDPRFTAVREVFAENFTKHGDVGATVCAYVEGESVVDLWGGYANRCQK